jgi:hypothetical protein
MRGASPGLLVGGFADPSALAALAAAIFCANFESGLEGLASAGSCDLEGVGEEVAGVWLGLALDEASRRCSARRANFDFGLPPSGVEAAGVGTDGPGVESGGEVLRARDNRCNAERGISGEEIRWRLAPFRRGCWSGVGSRWAGIVASPDGLSRYSIGGS